MTSRVYWVKPPSIMVPALNQYQQKLLLAIYAVAAYVGQAMQDDARRKAKWEDRTGNARSGVFFAVDGFGIAPITGAVGDISVDSSGRGQADQAVISGTSDRLVLALSHTMYYGKYLELSNGGRYAIIISTMQAHVPQLERMLKALLR